MVPFLHRKELVRLTPYIKRGLLYFDKQPQYYVEMNSDEDYVACYAVQPDHKKPDGSMAYTKKYDEIPLATTVYGDTAMGKVANRLKRVFKQQPQTTRQYHAPLFIANVEYGVDTFTNQASYGFYERYPDRMVVLPDEKLSAERQPNTGVFVSLDHIQWESTAVDLKAVGEQFKGESE